MLVKRAFFFFTHSFFQEKERGETKPNQSKQKHSVSYRLVSDVNESKAPGEMVVKSLSLRLLTPVESIQTLSFFFLSLSLSFRLLLLL